MAQQTFASCNVTEKEFGRAMRPYMVPPDLGYYTVDDRANPGCGLSQSTAVGPQERAPRRRDVMPPTWGRGGVPTVDTCNGRDVPGTLAAREMRSLETVVTEQGPIQLPFGPSNEVTYMPSSDTLMALPFTGTRRSGISDRYYK